MTFNNQWVRRLKFSLMAALLPMMLGCGDDNGPALAEVEGTVRLDGRPLAGAFVEFTPQQGSPSYGRTDEEGRYVLRYTREKQGAMLGQHLVRISTFQEENEEGRRVGERIPVQFNQKSQLVRDVQAGENNFDFPLSSQGAVLQPDRIRG